MTIRAVAAAPARASPRNRGVDASLATPATEAPRRAVAAASDEPPPGTGDDFTVKMGDRYLVAGDTFQLKRFDYASTTKDRSEASRFEVVEVCESIVNLKKEQWPVPPGFGFLRDRKTFGFLFVRPTAGLFHHRAELGGLADIVHSNTHGHSTGKALAFLLCGE